MAPSAFAMVNFSKLSILSEEYNTGFKSPIKYHPFLGKYLLSKESYFKNPKSEK